MSDMSLAPDGFACDECGRYTAPCVFLGLGCLYNPETGEGATSLCGLCLTKALEAPADPRLVRAVNELRSVFEGRAPAAEGPVPSSERYYILDTRQVVGNCALFWRPEGMGYTTDLKEAGLFSKDEIRNVRPTDVFIEAAAARTCAVTHVSLERLRAECNLREPSTPKPMPKIVDGLRGCEVEGCSSPATYRYKSPRQLPVFSCLVEHHRDAMLAMLPMTSRICTQSGRGFMPSGKVKS